VGDDEEKRQFYKLVWRPAEEQRAAAISFIIEKQLYQDFKNIDIAESCHTPSLGKKIRK
jgi:hypothetical protein